MSEYTFYIFSNVKFKDDLSLQDAIKQYKELATTDYKALGVEKDGMYCCDLVNNLGENNSDKISKDYTKMDNFKDDKMITVNTLEILQRELSL